MSSPQLAKLMLSISTRGDDTILFSKDVVILCWFLYISKTYVVARFSQIEGYKCLSLTRALGVVKCQLALV